MADRLALPPSLSSMHQVFHIFMLRRYIPDEYHVISLDLVEFGQDLNYEKEPVAILNKQEVEEQGDSFNNGLVMASARREAT